MTKKFLVKVWNQIHRDNRDCIIAVCGGTGSGKSTIALWLAQTLDTDYKGNTRFNSSRVVFGFNEWVTLLKDSHPAGTGILMEEPQAYFNSRMFASKTNLEAIAKFSTGRIFQYLYILTYPSFERIDSQIRERIHFLVNTDGIDRDRKLNFWRPYEVMPNWKPNMPVFRKPIVSGYEGSSVRLRCASPRPDEYLWDSYYDKSSEWKKMVKEGRVTNAGDLRVDEDPGVSIQRIVDKRKLQHEKMRSATRIRDLQMIEEKELRSCRSIGEIMRRGVSYVPAYRIWKILEEYNSEELINEANNQEIEKVLSRD